MALMNISSKTIADKEKSCQSMFAAFVGGYLLLKNRDKLEAYLAEESTEIKESLKNDMLNMLIVEKSVSESMAQEAFAYAVHNV